MDRAGRLRGFVCLISLLFLGATSGCITYNLYTPGYTAEEQAYLDKAMEFPLDFTITKDQANDGWGRAQSWVGRYASQRIQIATDYVLQTYSPFAAYTVKYGYDITKTPINYDLEFSVKWVVNWPMSHSWGEQNGSWGKEADAWGKQNAHILAYFIKTGELMPDIIEPFRALRFHSSESERQSQTRMGHRR